MKYFITLFFLSFIGYASPQQKLNLNLSLFDTMRIQLSLIPEDVSQHMYVMDWDDSSMPDDSTHKQFKPYELHCYIADSKGLIGSYTGLSTSFTFCPFQSTDSVIELIFVLRPHLNAIEHLYKNRAPDSTWLNTNIEYEKLRMPVKRTENLNARLIKKQVLVETVYIKNNCTKKRSVIIQPFNQKKSNQQMIKPGGLMRLPMKTGDKIKTNDFIYTHFAGNHKSIYLCDLFTYKQHGGQK